MDVYVIFNGFKLLYCIEFSTRRSFSLSVGKKIGVCVKVFFFVSQFFYLV